MASREVLAGALHVHVYANRAISGAAAASDFIAHVCKLLAARAPHGRVRVVFAAAPSQGEMLAALVTRRGELEWSRIDAFHMDEYIGLPASHTARFSVWLRTHVWDAVSPGSVHELDGSASDVAGECARYTALLRSAPVDVVLAGIGEGA